MKMEIIGPLILSVISGLSTLIGIIPIYFKYKNIDLDNALTTLFKEHTICALYTVMRIFGNQDIPQQLGWGRLYEEDVKRCRKISSSSELGKLYFIYSHFCV